eukprot:COSAG01_NODE_4583_length_4900_cov_9.820662_4_plen_54_part_00
MQLLSGPAWVATLRPELGGMGLLELGWTELAVTFFIVGSEKVDALGAAVGERG